MKTCSYPECGRQVLAKGLCSAHYSQLRTKGVLSPSQEMMTRNPLCSVEGCNDARWSSGMCQFHYTRKRKGRDLLAPRRPRRDHSHCDADGCERAARKNGLCAAHLAVANGRPFRPKVMKVGPVPKCKVAECEAIGNGGKGYCSGHYRQQWAGEKIRPIRRGRHLTWVKNRDGYLVTTYFARTGNGARIAQHRWIMEQHLGRPLERHETVHHINGVRDDNRLENLELWSSSQPPGQRVVDKLAWAMEIIAKYGPEEGSLQ